MKDIHKGLKGCQLEWITYPLGQKNETRGSDMKSVPNRQGHILPGDGERRTDGMIRRDSFTQSTRPRTHWRWTKTNRWDDQKRRLHSIDKATYDLEMDEDERMG